MREARVKRKLPTSTTIIGFLLILPGVLMLALMMWGIEPPFLRVLETYLESAPDTPNILSTLIFFTVVLVLPTIGILINFAATERRVLTYVLSSFKYAVITGFLLILPLIVLQMTLGRNNYSSFPFPVFGALWLFATMFLAIALPIVRNQKVRQLLLSNPSILALSIFFLVVLGFSWGGFVIDQWPCFMGVPNCD